MTNIRKVLADNIRTFRHEQGLSQAKLAEKVDTATHYILMIEAGRSWPSSEMLERIALALNKDSLDLFSLVPLQQDWQKQVLSDMEEFINEKRKTIGPK
jgi:transcriptional regulator with XRE-family HTH domain